MEKDLIPAPIDGKNVMRDWIEEIFDGCDCTFDGKNQHTGFVKGSACSCIYLNNNLFWQLHQNFCRDASSSYEELVRRLKEHDTPTLVVKYDDSMKSDLLLLQRFFFRAD